MNTIFINSTTYKNERRMTFEQLRIVIDNIARECGVALNIERNARGNVVLQYSSNNKWETMFECGTTTGMYWHVVDYREIVECFFHDVARKENK